MINEQESEQRRLLEWYTGKIESLKHAKEIAHVQYLKLVRQMDSEIANLQFTYGEGVKAATDALLNGSKRRSITLLTGTVCYRKTPEKLEITDEARASAWAETNCPEAVITQKRLVKTLLLKMFKETGEVPSGCEYVEPHDKFYPWFDKVQTWDEESEVTSDIEAI